MNSFADALRCGLTGRIMTDPVIVWTKANPELICGGSYERLALEQWLLEHRDGATKYGQNAALKDLCLLYHEAKGLACVI